MYKVAILGCENSHAADFLRVIRDENIQDVQVVGVYSCFPGAGEKLRDEFGVAVADSYDAFVGQIDGLIITARHGDNHYKYAKPYLDSGIPMFIDKPVTITESEAREFMQELKSKEIPISGGSTLKHASYIRELKSLVQFGEKGRVCGGFFRAPMDINSEHGGFYFYAQHLVQMVCELFGYDPKAVRACRNGDQVTCTIRYDSFDVTGVYLEHSYVYYAAVNFERHIEGSVFDLNGAASREFHDFYHILQGKPQTQSYEDFFAPVFIMNALERAMLSGSEETVNRM